METVSSRLLTIIIPCYNAENYLERCTSSLNSIDNNTISILFINDGSQDSTKQIIEKWVKCHPNAVLVNKENGGYCSAINTGLDNCTTEYVMILGVDDEIVSSALNDVCSCLKERKADIIYFSTIQKYDDVDDETDTLDELTHYGRPGFYKMDLTSICTKIKENARIIFTRDTSRCYKMTVVGNQRYFGRTGTASDGCFASIIASKAQSFEFVNEQCYIWHLHKDSVSGRKKTDERYVEELYVWEEYFKTIQKIYDSAKIPEPIISQWVIYKMLLKKTSKLQVDDDMVSHKDFAKHLRRWFLNGKGLSNLSYLKLWFPYGYERMINIYQSIMR